MLCCWLTSLADGTSMLIARIVSYIELELGLVARQATQRIATREPVVASFLFEVIGSLAFAEDFGLLEETHRVAASTKDGELLAMLAVHFLKHFIVRPEASARPRHLVPPHCASAGMHWDPAAFSFQGRSWLERMLRENTLSNCQL